MFQPIQYGPSIFYHEDDYLQVEILPSENYTNLKIESEKVETFAKEHFDGEGFTDIYVRNDKNKVKLSQKQIAPKELEEILSLIGLNRIANVLTGYGQTFREPRKDCIAFGKDYCAVYYSFKDNIVQHIWFTDHWSMDREKLASCLHEIGQWWDLVFQDWNLAVTIDLKEKNSIDQYLGIYDTK